MSLIRGPLGSTVSSSQEKPEPGAKPPPPANRFTRSSYTREPALPPKPDVKDNKTMNGSDSTYEKTYTSRYGSSGSSFSERYSSQNSTESRFSSQNSTESRFSSSSSVETKPTPAPVLSSRPQLSTAGTRLSSKREAFFKGDQSYTPKFDPPSFRDKQAPAPTINSTEKEDFSSKDRVVKDQPIEIDGYVGFANLPNQVYRKSVKRGFEFSLMVVGESGLGKSTMINSLFLTDIYSGDHPGPSARLRKTLSGKMWKPTKTDWIVETNQVLVKENGVQLKLTIVDTPGFGDAVDNSNCWDPVIDYINSKYDSFLNAESRVMRKEHPDSRVHCCVYFIAPSGHGLKPLDVEFMKRLHDKVNIIPVIAKADCMTIDEIREFKKTILNEIQQHKIKIYEFPDIADDDEGKNNKRMKERVPFAVVGSNAIINVGGQALRGRVYPWGTVEVENLEHNDFIALRNMVLRTHMQDLKDVTNNVHYENFRYNKLSGVQHEDGKAKSGSSTKSPLLQMEEEKKEHDAKLKKMEAEMEQVFEMKVKEKKQKLKDSEADLQRRAEQMKKSLEQQERELEEKRKAFEKEKQIWEESMRLDERRRSLENSRDSIDAGKKEKKDKKKGLF